MSVIIEKSVSIWCIAQLFWTKNSGHWLIRYQLGISFLHNPNVYVRWFIFHNWWSTIRENILTLHNVIVSKIIVWPSQNDKKLNSYSVVRDNDFLFLSQKLDIIRNDISQSSNLKIWWRHLTLQKQFRLDAQILYYTSIISYLIFFGLNQSFSPSNRKCAFCAGQR